MGEVQAVNEASPALGKIVWGLLVAVFVGVMLGIGVWAWQGGWKRTAGGEERLLEGLKVYGVVPDFELTERSGMPFRLRELRGQIWVAQFFYTHCQDVCLLTVPEMGLLQLQFKDEPHIRFVSITADPERDTPRVLRAFADRFSAERGRWFFLTGDKIVIYRLAQEGLRLGMGEIQNAPDEQQKTGEEKEILHPSRFILVDRLMRIRGYYSGIDVESVARLSRDLKKLLRNREKAP